MARFVAFWGCDMSGIDSLRPAFFEECEDLLARVGEGLHRISPDSPAPDMEGIHDIFRAVHSIKGGAGAFGLSSLVSFAHGFETVLDRMRSGKMVADAAALQTLLKAFDILSDLVAAARDGLAEPAQMPRVLEDLDLLAEGDAPWQEPEVAFQPLMLDIAALDLALPEPEQTRHLIHFRPGPGFFDQGHEAVAILRALAGLGELGVEADLSDVPALSLLDLARPNLRWRLDLHSRAPRSDLTDLFDMIQDLAEVEITSLPQDTRQDAWQMTSPDPVGLLPEDYPAPHPVEPPPATPAPAAPASLRVSLGRVDRLVNLIGELVIMEAMLEQAIVSAGVRNNADIAGSLEGMKQLAANIQETVMSIRAQPLKSVFQRMERITREAAEATGKKVRLQMAGEMTEVDKTVVERLVDPLTHMIRNSVDHGIEATARRQAAHKPEEGVITLSAAHRSGRVLIEVTDDGGGIDRARVRDIAEARGLVPQGAPLTPAEIDNLLFLPGFSSKAEVSALSGRGVGLDVVRREIQALGGRVSIQSTPGEGTSFTIALPLTLAVLEGMLIRVGPETMVLPISVIVETLRLDETQIHDIGQNLRVMFHRGAMIPVINLAHRFGFATSPPQDRRVLILIECDGGRRAALETEDIQDQRQVVIKSVEENYGTIDGIAAATILGDGKVALIIDPEEIVQSSAMTPPSAPLVVNG